MNNNDILQVNIDKTKLYLHSESNIYKTEKFLKTTKFVLGIDKLLDVVAGAIKTNIESTFFDTSKSYMIETSGSEFTLFCKLGESIKDSLKKYDVVFYKFLSKDKLDRSNDRSVETLMSKSNVLVLNIQKINDNIDESAFNKLYILTQTDGVNFPLLNDSQMDIVLVEDKNVLVQGVAGSGKTNICIDKIVFSACREYHGKVLYTTYSRGLLLDTKLKVEAFKNKLSHFVSMYNEGKVEFLDDNHKTAIEENLGVYFDCDGDSKIVEKITKIVDFLENNVDYYLLHDLYKKHISSGANFVDQNYFINTYLKDIKNHQLTSKLEKVKHLSYEIIYKEIYGLIRGRDSENGSVTLDSYIMDRKNSFSRYECEVIYSLALDFDKYMQEHNLVDNNTISRMLLEKNIPLYSLSIVDEVQDFTEINLKLIKNISRKVFAVGDAMQMINPTYFSFAYLKRLLYDKETVDVIELKHNYRNTKRISNIVEELNKINVIAFGTHSFVLKNESIDSTDTALTLKVKSGDFAYAIQKEKYEDITIIVSDVKAKDNLKRMLPNVEILTVSEVKGLERDNIIIWNILTDNIDKWESYTRTNISRKVADENSVYRYYYNLFYVGLTRAKRNIVVYEDKSVQVFNEFFNENFDEVDVNQAVNTMNAVVSKGGIDVNEYISRVNEFITLGQYDNAYFTANKINDGKLRQQAVDKIEIYRDYVFSGKHREAGIKFWQCGQIMEAKKQFELSKDSKLIDLMDVSLNGGSGMLSMDILDYYPLVLDNDVAKDLILKMLSDDFTKLKDIDNKIKNKFKDIKR